MRRASSGKLFMISRDGMCCEPVNETCREVRAKCHFNRPHRI